MLEALISSRIIDTNDEGLRHLTFTQPKVIAKFTAENCPICKMLEPAFVRFAEAETYHDIVFVRLNSNENPVAKQLMDQRVAPFFVSYCQGRMLECDTRNTEADVVSQLNRLHADNSLAG